jgi:hypothetical protein
VSYYTPDLNPSSDPGGRVQVEVWYQKDPSDCGAHIYITQSKIKFIVSPNPGQDLYWDEEYYHGASKEMGCKQVTISPQYNCFGSTWRTFPNHWFTDETINDTSFGCDWWGEEFTGSVFLNY